MTPWKQNLKNESGQSIVMVVIMIASFLMFFAFVINTGILITAKISLQTAADAAAYAGAATQARQLNNISYLNYDLRRQYKKFMFRYLVVGNFSRGKQMLPAEYTTPGLSSTNAAPPPSSDKFEFYIKSFKNSGSTASWIPMKIPAICIPLTTKGQADDTCISADHTNAAYTMTTIGLASGDLIVQTLQNNLAAMSAVADNICRSRGSINKYVTWAWIFKGNIDSSSLSQFFDPILTQGSQGAPPNTPQLNPQEKADMISLVSSITDGLGVYPRNILNTMRIETLQKFINEPPKSDVDQSWIESNKSESNERTILAFKSALTNLNSNTFAPDTLTMNEIITPNPLNISFVKVDFNTYYQDIERAPPKIDAQQSCVMAVQVQDVMQLPVSAYAEKMQVNYAVKLRAKAKLFLPSPMSIDLEAVAGAEPFGSRIGPPKSRLNSSEFVEKIIPDSIVRNPEIENCSHSDCNIPRIKIANSSKTTSLTANFLNIFNLQSKPSGVVDANSIKTAMIAATAPNPEEVGLYNILPPPTSDTQAAPFDFVSISASDSKKPVYRFYAPLFPSGSSDVSAQIDKYLAQMFPSTSVASNSNYDPAKLRAAIALQLSTYVKNLQSAQPNTTENGETETFAAIELPMPPGLPAPQNGYWLNQEKQVLSSWAPDNVRISQSQYNGTGSANVIKPRFGFSVKFVPVQDLVARGMPDTDGDLSKVNH